MRRRALRLRLVAATGLLAFAGSLQSGCAPCTGRSPVAGSPSVGGSVGSSGGTTWRSGGMGLDLGALFCRPPDPATLPQPGPGSPPIPDAPASRKAPEAPLEPL